MGVDVEMFVKHKGKLEEIEVRRVGAELVKRFGKEQFFLDVEGIYGKPSHALEISSEPIHKQDGPDIIGEKGEQFIKVNLATRYYGKRYERGHFPTIYLVAIFLESRIPNCEVWYGGDSSGICAELFNKAARQDLLNHWIEFGHEPYYRSYSLPCFVSEVPICDFCGGIPMHNVGGGGGREFWSCDGCGKRLVRKKGELFKANERWEEDVNLS